MEVKALTLLPSKPRKLRTHNKSRGGCLRCKARKVKCSEERPRCSNCAKAQCPCRYALDRGIEATVVARPATLLPNHKHNMVEISRTNAGVQQHSRIKSMPGVHSTFSHSDLRAFHHFLTVAFPRLPLGTERAWKTDVPAMSHEVSDLPGLNGGPKHAPSIHDNQHAQFIG